MLGCFSVSFPPTVVTQWLAWTTVVQRTCAPVPRRAPEKPSKGRGGATVWQTFADGEAALLAKPRNVGGELRRAPSLPRRILGLHRNQPGIPISMLRVLLVGFIRHRCEGRVFPRAWLDVCRDCDGAKQRHVVGCCWSRRSALSSPSFCCYFVSCRRRVRAPTSAGLRSSLVMARGSCQCQTAPRFAAIRPLLHGPVHCRHRAAQRTRSSRGT